MWIGDGFKTFGMLSKFVMDCFFGISELSLLFYDALFCFLVHVVVAGVQGAP